MPGWVGGIHIGLRTQILLLGIAGVVVTGLIDLGGLRIEAESGEIADRFGMLKSFTASLSENLLRGREIATEFLQKPSEKKVASHDEAMKTVLRDLDEIEAIAATLSEQDALRKALSFRAIINNYATRFSNVVSARKLIGYAENDGLQGKLRAAVH